MTEFTESGDAERVTTAAIALDDINHQIDIAGQVVDLAPAHRVRDYIRDTLRQVAGDMIDGPASPDQIKARLTAHGQAERDYTDFSNAAIDAGLAGFENDDDTGSPPIWTLLCRAPAWWSSDLLEAGVDNLHILAVAYRTLMYGDVAPEGHVRENIDGLVLKRIINQLLAA